MPAGSYLKLRWMVMGCVNKQGQEIKCHIFWRANCSLETERQDSTEETLGGGGKAKNPQPPQNKKTPPCIISPSP